MTRRLSVGLLLFGLLLAPPAASASDSWLSSLNAQRTANGIPPVLDATNPVNPFASRMQCHDQGGGIASTSSFWGPATSPWRNAPLHEMDLYMPRFTAASYYTFDDGTCMVMGFVPGSPPPPEITSPTFYTFAGPAGPSAVPTSSVVSFELPYHPAEAIGFEPGDRTGPILLLYGWLPEPGRESTPPADPLAFTVTRADSGAPVDAAMLTTGNTKGLAIRKGVEASPITGGILVIREPLPPSTRFNVSLSWANSSGSETVPQSFSFATAPAPTQSRGRKMSVSAKADQRLIRAWVSYPSGTTGRLKAIAKCSKPRSTTRLRVVSHRAKVGVARLRGRVPRSCSKARVIAILIGSDQLPLGIARSRLLTIR